MSDQAKDEEHREQYRKPKEVKNETESKKLAIDGKARRIALSLICGSPVGRMLLFGFKKAAFSYGKEFGIFIATIIAIQFVNNKGRIFK